MTLEQYEKLIAPIIKQAEQDGDKFCFVYFSQEADEYKGNLDLDFGDALIVVDKIIDFAGIDRAGLGLQKENK